MWNFWSVTVSFLDPVNAVDGREGIVLSLQIAEDAGIVDECGEIEVVLRKHDGDGLEPAGDNGLILDAPVVDLDDVAGVTCLSQFPDRVDESRLVPRLHVVGIPRSG